MTAEEWQGVRNLFDELLDLPRREQERRIEQAALSGEQRARLMTMLEASSAGGILDGAPPVLDDGVETRTYSSLAAGDRIGAFEVDRLIGRGGMGEVYLARRISGGFEQLVALKLLRAEVADRLELFDRERRMLARLEHPGIARLIDGGAAPDGRPYMAMEYVDGEAIDRWCKRNGASLGQRLVLFSAICDAVGYAHSHLIVHRDLKPSNILVDGQGKVRLLDFGIARLMDETAVLPATTQAMLTPDFAAPEQLEGDQATVATDIYALGGVLFELLTGLGPWRRSNNSMPAIIRRILTEDPPVPSRVAAGQAAPPVSAADLAGDLDAIMLKALRRVPTERYRTVAELSDDIGRHQKLLPVRARTGSTSYMIGRFVRRNRWAVAGAGAALAAILMGAGGFAWQAHKTAVERDVALSEAQRSDAIVRMLTLMFRESSEQANSEDPTVKQMLSNTAHRLVNSVDASAESAAVLITLHDLFVNIDDPAGADALMRQALARGIGADDPVATARIKLRLASTAAQLGKIEEMPRLIADADRVFSTDPQRFRDERLELVSAKAQLARREGRLDDAINLMAGSMAEADQVYGGNSRELLTRYNNLFVYMLEANRLDEMPALFARADAALERTGQVASMQGLSIAELKSVWRHKRGDFVGAERIVADIADRREKSFGSSAALAVDLYHLGRARLAQGKYAPAKEALARARPIAIENLGPRAVPSLNIALTLAECHAELGDTAAASRLLTEVAPLVMTLPKTGLPHAAIERLRAIIALRQGKMSDARAALGRADAILAGLGKTGGFERAQLVPIARRIEARNKGRGPE